MTKKKAADKKKSNTQEQIDSLWDDFKNIKYDIYLLSRNADASYLDIKLHGEMLNSMKALINSVESRHNSIIRFVILAQLVQAIGLALIAWKFGYLTF